MRRPPYHAYHHRYHRGYRGAPGRQPLGPLLVLLIVVLLAGGAMMAAMIAATVVTVAPFGLLAAGAVAFRVVRRAQRRGLGYRGRGGYRDTVAPAPAAAADPSAEASRRSLLVRDWAASKASFDKLRGEYAQFECDPLAVLRLPALTDVSVGATGRFVDVFAEAQALDTDEEPPPEHRDRYATAVDAAWRAWRAALDAAERIRLSGIPTEERATVQRAIKLLTVARDSAHDTERTAAYARARAELAKLERSGTLRLPPTAAAALDAAARAQLPPASR